MPIPRRPLGHMPHGSGYNHHTRYHQSWMDELEIQIPEWHSQAACSGMNPSGFMLRDMDSMVVGNSNDLWKLNDERVKAAQTVCHSCPVRQECFDDANEEDLNWTVRGGQRPRALTVPRGRPKKGAPENLHSRNEKPCTRGHKGMWRYSRSKWTCKGCEKLSRDEKYEGKPRKPLSENCVNGHNNWFYEKNGTRRCRTCKNDARRARYANMGV